MPVLEYTAKGVNTMCSHHDADTYSVIVSDPAQPVGVGFFERPCKWFSEATTDKPAGTQSLFQELPLELPPLC